MTELDKNIQQDGDLLAKGRKAFPLFQGLVPIDPAGVLRDVLAGVTLAALAIPAVMGYTRIAGMPVVTGLYTLLLPAIVFAVFGSSRLLVVGADSATAAIMAAFLSSQYQPASADWVAAAGMLALLTAVLLIAIRLARLAFLADFLSRTVLVGFLTGVGIQVALGELPGLLGLQVPTAGTVDRLWYTLLHLKDTHVADALVGIIVVAVTQALRKWSKVPGVLIAVLAAMTMSWAFDLHAQGVAILGPLRGGLPRMALPGDAWAWAHLSSLLPTAAAMAVVILTQSAATSRASAWKYGYGFDENVDLTGLALANLGAGVTGTFVVNGSPTKTQMVDAAGGRSQLSHLTMAAVVLLVLLFFTEPITFLPIAALSAVVFLIGLELTDFGELRRILAARRSEFWVAAATAATVVLAGVEQAIALAMLLSLIDHVRRGYQPRNSVIVRGEDGHARLLPALVPQEYAPGVLVYRFSHSMYYANAEVISREVLALARAAQPPLQWLVIDMSAVDDVDFSAGATLASLEDQLARQGTVIKFLRPNDAVVASLRAYGLVKASDDKVFASIREMRRRFRDTQDASA